MAEDTKLDTSGIDKLLRALKAPPPMGRIGVLGTKDARKESEGPSNAEIGAKHEFGQEGMPVRSFLRVPLTDHLEKYLTARGAFDKATIKQVIKEGTVVPWVKKMMIVAEEIVKEGFATGGFGKWPAWRNKSYTSKTGMLLVDTTQLRDSITSEVKDQ